MSLEAVILDGRLRFKIIQAECRLLYPWGLGCPPPGGISTLQQTVYIPTTLNSPQYHLYLQLERAIVMNIFTDSFMQWHCCESIIETPAMKPYSNSLKYTSFSIILEPAKIEHSFKITNLIFHQILYIRVYFLEICKTLSVLVKCTLLPFHFKTNYIKYLLGRISDSSKI